MATNFTVVVILPNARRMNVKANSNSILLQVLEDVCTKHELNPIEWDLTHHNKIVDVGNSIRFAGIPNNATLEMVKCTKPRKESSVNLGIQLESGKRLQHPFLPHQTLWEVLEYWAEQGEDVYPPKDNELETEAVCIYMRQEVLGEEQLKNKTLRGLGLTQGSAMIRLLHRSASQLKHQANVSAPLSRTVIPERNESPIHSSNVGPPSSKAATDELRKVPEPEVVPKPAPVSYQSEPEPMDLSTDSTVPATNGLSSSSTLSETIDISTKVSQPVEQTCNLPPAITNAQRYSTLGQFHVLGARDAILFHGDDVAVSTSQEFLQDDFFEITVNDVRKMYRDLKDRSAKLEESPLQTRSTREFEKDAAMLQNLKDHPNTIVRIRFGNRYVLQGTFRTADTIESVGTWLKAFLNNTELNFYLFDTPPKRILAKETRLVEEGMVGMAVIYFGSEDPSVPFDQKALKPEIYEKVSDPVAAFEFIRTKLGKEKTSGDTPSTDQQSSLAACQTSASQGTSASSSSGSSNSEAPSERRAIQQPRPVPGTSGGTGNAPKWFKLGK